MPKRSKGFEWNRHVTESQAESIKRRESGQAASLPNTHTGTKPSYDKYRYVVRDKVSGLFLKTRKSSAARGNGYLLMQVVMEYSSATKYRSTDDAAHALKTFNSKLNKTTFRNDIIKKFGIVIKLGPEFNVINCDKLTDIEKYPERELEPHFKEQVWFDESTTYKEGNN
jgi:hypothetical protein